mgnify:CR=1 FL=1
MKILVTAKRIPDPTQKLKLKDNALDLGGANWQLNQFDEYAVEAALRLTEDGANQAVRQGQVTVASLGPADVATQLRSALAMGADKAIRVDAKDDDLDASIVAKTIVKLVQRDQPDLVLMGKLAADNEGNDVGQRVAGILGWPQATFACSIQVVDGGKAVIVGREVDAGVELKKVQRPAVVTAKALTRPPFTCCRMDGALAINTSIWPLSRRHRSPSRIGALSTANTMPEA